MTRIAQAFGLNIWELLAAARTKNFGFELCDPGLIGGHCIPIDPHYLAWATRSYRVAAHFVDAAEMAHQRMNRYAFELVHRLLNHWDKSLLHARVLIFGVTYKKDVDDMREAPAHTLMKRLYLHGAQVAYWDPILGSSHLRGPFQLSFSQAEIAQLPPPSVAKLEAAHDDSAAVVIPAQLGGEWPQIRPRVIGGDFDCIVVNTAHTIFNDTYQEILAEGPPVADLRNALGHWLESEAIASPERIREVVAMMERDGRCMLLGVD